MFMVYDEPYCIWDSDLKKINLDFINSMNPEYFENVVVHNFEQIEGDKKDLAAISIRLAYFHGMETFFSLICAALQAPECIIGWLQKYPPGSLQKMVKDINSGIGIKTRSELHKKSWEEISVAVLNYLVLEDKEKEKEIKEKFGIFWNELSKEFTDELLTSEYNNLKHGFRIHSSGFYLSMGLEKECGVSPPLDEFVSMGGNEFGTSFFMQENICEKGVPNGKYHFRVRQYNVNWDPYTIGFRVRLLSSSIQNVLSFLKIINGVRPDKVQFHWPSDLSVFEEAFRPLSGPMHMSSGTIINQKHIKVFTKEEILATLNSKKEYETH